MRWWRQPFTLIVVPHDGAQSRSMSFRWKSVIVTSVVLLLFLLGGSYFTYVGMKRTWLELDGTIHQYKQRIARLREQARSARRVNKAMASLRQQLQQSRQLHQQILEITGFETLQEGPSNASPGRTGASLRASAQFLNLQIDRVVKQNQRLRRVKKFMKQRQTVFDHIPTLWPSEGWMSSPYGYRKDPMGGKGRDFHQGVDVAAWRGSPVRAPARAKVVQAGWKGGYGRRVKLRHRYGFSTVYGHLSRIQVEEGQKVDKGDVIGRVGNTGHSTGSHVHYEVHINGQSVNPWPYLVEHFDFYRKVQKLKQDS